MKKWLKLNYRYYVTFLLAFVSIMLIKIPDWFGNFIWLDRKLNMNQNTISRYENMERQADYETLIGFADYFGVSLDYLLGRCDCDEKKK